MGHAIEHQIVIGDCQLTQCSCGRGCLKIGTRTILVSSAEIKELTGIFSQLGTEQKKNTSHWMSKLNELTGESSWGEFSVPQ